MKNGLPRGIERKCRDTPPGHLRIQEDAILFVDSGKRLVYILCTNKTRSNNSIMKFIYYYVNANIFSLTNDKDILN